MVCVSEPTLSGCLIPVTAIAGFRMSDDKGQLALQLIGESRARRQERAS